MPGASSVICNTNGLSVISLEIELGNGVECKINKAFNITRVANYLKSSRYKSSAPQKGKKLLPNNRTHSWSDHLQML